MNTPEISSGDDNALTVATCVERMGRIEMLVNNAGYAYRAGFGELDVARMRAVFDVKVFDLVGIPYPGPIFRAPRRLASLPYTR